MQDASMPPSRAQSSTSESIDTLRPSSKDRDRPRLTRLVKGQALVLKPLLRGSSAAAMDDSVKEGHHGYLSAAPHLD